MLFLCFQNFGVLQNSELLAVLGAVSLGAWLIGLEVEHVDDRSLCCATSPNCKWKKQSGNVCAAFFDWSCSGICKSVDGMRAIHNARSDGDGAVWTSNF